jgi:hypothetical protein
LSEEDFWNAMIKLDYSDLPWAKAFSKLLRQAKMRCPGNGRHALEERCLLSEKLQKQYQFLRILIGRINETIQHKAERVLLGTALEASRLKNVIREGEFADTVTAIAAWIKRSPDKDGETPFILRLLRSYPDVIQTAGPQIESLATRIDSLANNLALLMKNILAHEASLKLIQDRYFDGNPVLYRNNENMLKQAINATVDSIQQFNDFLSFQQRARIEAMRKSPGLIDVKRIIHEARVSATVDMLREGGVDGAYRWRVFRSMTEREFNYDALASDD